jgi:hypothetical protein
MKRSLFVITILCLLLGCATYPPPKIEGNRYQNYHHGFVLELPGEPWQATDKVPDWLKSMMLADNRPTSTVQLLIFNNQANAFITVNCEKNRIDIPHFDYGDFRIIIEEEYEQMKKEALKIDQITRFDYNVGYCSKSPGKANLCWSTEMNFETDTQKTRIISKGNVYPIHYDAHFLTIGLWSNQLTFDESLVVFNKLYESLEWSESLTKPTAE